MRYKVSVSDPRYMPRVLETDDYEQAETYQLSALKCCPARFVYFEDRNATNNSKGE